MSLGQRNIKDRHVIQHAVPIAVAGLCQLRADKNGILESGISPQRIRHRLRGNTARQRLVSIAIDSQIGAVVNHRPMFPLIQERRDRGGSELRPSRSAICGMARAQV